MMIVPASTRTAGIGGDIRARPPLLLCYYSHPRYTDAVLAQPDYAIFPRLILYTTRYYVALEYTQQQQRLGTTTPYIVKEILCQQ